MTKNTTIIGLGLLIASMPFLGFPRGIETTVFVVAGLLIASIAFVTHTKSNPTAMQETSEDRETDMFVESINEKKETPVSDDIVMTEKEDVHEEEIT